MELDALLGLDEFNSKAGDLPRRKLPVRFRRLQRQQSRIARTAKATAARTTPRMIPSFLSLGYDLFDGVGVAVDVGLWFVAVAAGDVSEDAVLLAVSDGVAELLSLSGS